MKPGRDLDILIADKIFQMRCPSFVSCGRGRGVWENSIPNYSTDIKAAWEVVQKVPTYERKFRDKYCETNDFFLIKRRDHWITKKDYWVAGYASYPEDWEIHVEAETAPHAICLATLKAVGFELEPPSHE